MKNVKKIYNWTSHVIYENDNIGCVEEIDSDSGMTYFNDYDCVIKEHGFAVQCPNCQTNNWIWIDYEDNDKNLYRGGFTGSDLPRKIANAFKEDV